MKCVQAARLSSSTVRNQGTMRFQLAKFRLTSLRSHLSRRLSAVALAKADPTARCELRLAGHVPP